MSSPASASAAALRPALRDAEPCWSLLVTEEISNEGWANNNAAATKSSVMRNKRISPERNTRRIVNQRIPPRARGIKRPYRRDKPQSMPLAQAYHPVYARASDV